MQKSVRYLTSCFTCWDVTVGWIQLRRRCLRGKSGTKLTHTWMRECSLRWPVELLLHLWVRISSLFNKIYLILWRSILNIFGWLRFHCTGDQFAPFSKKEKEKKNCFWKCYSAFNIRYGYLLGRMVEIK